MSGTAGNVDMNLQVRREFYSTDGKTPMDPKQFVQGDLYQVHINISSKLHSKNLAVVDLLPGGLEIESPNLKGSTQSKEEYWGTLLPEHVERRDDRLLIFASILPGQGSYRYLVRAVTPGEWILPAVDASCMYDPDIQSTHGAGQIRVLHRAK
ncbi:MAG: hypothetical protein HQL31_05200 [Planctomycetes bacterium]|nr:hypothetical protein [Planctomycetota bacterium]